MERVALDMPKDGVGRRPAAAQADRLWQRPVRLWKMGQGLRASGDVKWNPFWVIDSVFL